MLREKNAFLFDLDGTLVDSDFLHAAAFGESLDAHMPELAKGFSYGLLRGLSTRDAFRSMGVADEEVLDTLVASKRSCYRTLVSRGFLKPLPGSLELLTHLQQADRHLCLVTGGSRLSVEQVLVATGLSVFFRHEHIITAEDVSRGKPAPDLYTLAISRIGLDTHQCVGIEDSLLGMLACTRAGLECVVVNDSVAVWPNVPVYPSLMALLKVLR